MNPEKAKELMNRLPNDHDEALEFIRKECDLPVGFSQSDVSLNSDYWDWMNAFRGKFNPNN